jgi:hypothetical protein
LLVAYSDDFNPRGYQERIAAIQSRLHNSSGIKRRYKPEFKDSRCTDSDIIALSSRAFGCSPWFLEMHRQYERARVARLLAIRTMVGVGRNQTHIMSAMRCREKDLTLACVEFEDILPNGEYTAQEMIRFGADGYGEINEASPPEEIKHLVADRFGVSVAGMDNTKRATDDFVAREAFLAICNAIVPENELATGRQSGIVKDMHAVTRASRRLAPIIDGIELSHRAPAYMWVDAVARRLGK